MFNIFSEQRFNFRQPTFNSRTIIWVIVLVTGFGIIWASVAQTDEAVSATGKLEPLDEVEPVQAPVGGVIDEVLVMEGQLVKKGQPLVRFDQTAAQAQLKSLQDIRDRLTQENQFYRFQLLDSQSAVKPSSSVQTLPQLSPEILSLTQNRSSLVAENRLYRLQLNRSSPSQLKGEELLRYQSAIRERKSRELAAKLEVDQLQRQLVQTQLSINNARELLDINRNILRSIEPVVKSGAISEIQFLQQQQQVSTRQSELNRLVEEKVRLGFAILQGRQRFENTTAQTESGQLKDISDNDKRIAEIDSQLNKVIVENDKRLAEINGQLSQVELTLKYQVMNAPVNGLVFDLKPKGRGYVANTSEPILKIVPDGKMLAKVFITNQDIGFVRPGMAVDIRVDSFPYSEFGDVKGKLIKISADALPPDQLYSFYRFPADIELEQQSLLVRDRQVNLQSGMSVTANIPTRKRTFLSLLTGLVTEKIDRVKSSR